MTSSPLQTIEILKSFALFFSSSLLYICYEQKQLKKDSFPIKLSKDETEKIRKRHFCNRVTLSYSNSGPLMIMKGYGSRLISSDGVSYLDTRNNVAHCGHNHPKIVAAIQHQVQTLNTNTRYLHPNITLLAAALANMFPDPLEIVFFVNSGSEANDLALRLARAHTRSKNTIVVDRAYHGHTLGTLDVSPYKYENSKEYALVSSTKTSADYIWKVPCPDTFRGEHRGDDAAHRYADYVKRICKLIKNKGESPGAFIVESGMSVAGVILPPQGYLSKCAAHIRNEGGVYIADEVQTGFGRLGSCDWGFQYHAADDCVPDIVTVGKPFGNGMPLAAVITTRKISNSFEKMGVEYFNTFGGNPVCAAAGLAVLGVLKSEHLKQNAEIVGNYMKKRFTDLSKELPLIGDIRGAGFFLGIEMMRDKLTMEPATKETSFLCTILKEKYHILSSIDGPFENVLVVKPPMVFNKEDADQFVVSFRLAILDDLKNLKDIDSIDATPT